MKIIIIALLLGSLQATTINIGTGVITNLGGSRGGGSFIFGGDSPGVGSFDFTKLLCFPCNTGSTVPSFYLGNTGTDLSGSITYDGIPYTLFGAGLLISGGSILLDRGAGTYTGSFSLEGTACSLPACGFPGGYGVQLRGIGNYEARFETGQWPDRSLLSYMGGTFTLTPEPSTMLLVTFGLVALTLRRRL